MFWDGVCFFLQLLSPPLLLALLPLPCFPLLLLLLPFSFLILLFLSSASSSHPCHYYLSLSLSPLSPAFLNHFDICQIPVALLSQAVSFFGLMSWKIISANSLASSVHWCQEHPECLLCWENCDFQAQTLSTSLPTPLDFWIIHTHPFFPRWYFRDVHLFLASSVTASIKFFFFSFSA